MPVLCPSCRRFDGRAACTSFPGGIPDEILVWGGDHRETSSGELPFELDPERREAYDEWVRYMLPALEGPQDG